LARAVQSAGAMNPKAVELQRRTQKFATDIIAFCERLAPNAAVRKIVDQLLDSAGATHSNYRATCRAKSSADFISKIGTAVEEADESKGWLELPVSSNMTTMEEAGALIQEADELTAIFVKSKKTAERNKQNREAIEDQLRNRRRK